MAHTFFRPQNSQMDAILREKSSIEWRLGELDKLYNDAKWRFDRLIKIFVN